MCKHLPGAVVSIHTNKQQNNQRQPGKVTDQERGAGKKNKEHQGEH